MTIHKKPSQLAGKTVRIKQDVFAHGGKEFVVRDWWDRCSGYRWLITIVNPICAAYALRASFSKNTEMVSDEVLYGTLGAFPYLFHISEIE
jgi:hypothetical protein